MDLDEPLDPAELETTLKTYRKLADDVANHETILKVYINFYQHVIFHTDLFSKGMTMFTGQNSFILHRLCFGSSKFGHS